MTASTLRASTTRCAARSPRPAAWRRGGPHIPTRRVPGAQDKAKRSDESTLEMLWRASPSLGANAQVFTGVLYYHYGPPPGFCWDQSCADDPMRDDERLEEYNVQQRVDDFVKVVTAQADHYRGGHVMLTMGSDFQYENANKWYKNLDKLIHYVNKDGRLNAFYSTPSLYTEAKHAANLTWSVKEDDFFPCTPGEGEAAPPALTLPPHTHPTLRRRRLPALLLDGLLHQPGCAEAIREAAVGVSERRAPGAGGSRWPV